MWNLIDLDKSIKGQGDTIYEFETKEKMFQFIDDCIILNFKCWFVNSAPFYKPTSSKLIP